MSLSKLHSLLLDLLKTIVSDAAKDTRRDFFDGAIRPLYEGLDSIRKEYEAWTIVEQDYDKLSILFGRFKYSSAEKDLEQRKSEKNS
jgi:hypothetical protein